MTASLLLDQTSWDLVIDIAGNIAVASEPFSIAQDVACAIRLFRGELWYDTSRGVPYFGQVLGHFPSLPVVKALIKKAALTVPSVQSAEVFISRVEGRKVSGQVRVTTQAGASIHVGF